MAKIALFIAWCLVAAIVGAGIVWLTSGAEPAPTPAPAADPADAIRTTLPFTPATDEPDLVGFDKAAPAAGTVAQVTGPFDDRFAFAHLRFDGKEVSGRVTITSDVSDLLELEVLAAFYDGQGDLVGQARCYLPPRRGNPHARRRAVGDSNLPRSGTATPPRPGCRCGGRYPGLSQRVASSWTSSASHDDF